MNSFRLLTVSEKDAVRKILASEPENREFLLKKIPGLLIREVDETLYEFSSDKIPIMGSKRTFGLPVECTYKDVDGMIVFVDLFVDEGGRLAELEVWKPSGGKISTYFSDAELAVHLESW